MTDIRGPLGILCLIICLATGRPALAQVRCGGYTLGFFNGMWTTKPGALENLGQLGSLRPDFDGMPVVPDLFYNQTSGGLEDLFEVFQQRVAERAGTEAGMVLEARQEIFWELLRSEVGGPLTISRRIADAASRLTPAFLEIQQALASRAVAGVGEVLSAPPTFADYTEHKARMDGHLVRGRSVVGVGHSQGSLFLNAAHDYVAQLYGSDLIRAVYVAPASSTLRGCPGSSCEYTLSGNDLVIDSLLRAFGAVASSTLSIPIRAEDLTGHDLYATYLNPEFAGSSSVDQGIFRAFGAVQLPTAQNCAACTVDCQGLPCANGQCSSPVGTGLVTIAVRTVFGPSTNAAFSVFMQAVRPPPGSEGFPFWASVIPSTEAGFAVVVAPGSTIVGETLVDGYLSFFSPGCFGPIEAQEVHPCRILNCWDGDDRWREDAECSAARASEQWW